MSLSRDPTLMHVAKMTARDLRRHSTEAEKIFWRVVRNRQFYGWKFLRQHYFPVECRDRETFFVADFYCADAGLIMEIDGDIHTTQCEQDAMRTILLQEQGLCIVRFTNAEILGDLDGVLRRLLEKLRSLPLSSG